MPPKLHHTGKGFKNIYGSNCPGFFDFLKWQWDRLWMHGPSRGSYNFPLAKSRSDLLRSNRSQTTLTWIGHATVLLQLHGSNILTDPNFSDRASPLRFAGPKRVMPPGIAVDELPPIDVVAISHDHYDSMDKSTIGRLRGRQGGSNTTFFVPLGLKRWFEDLGISNVIEMDWWERQSRNGIEVICVPIHHWSQRVPFSRNTTLWSAWVIRDLDFSFFFAGDSGYAPHF
ncbi:MAG: MBL fold metallo-hydrolase, partial [Deltaproteobacteria bacterium]|nr:MBL fold metallo-hydrolase [Deltaproteobacteria bacterium]